MNAHPCPAHPQMTTDGWLQAPGKDCPSRLGVGRCGLCHPQWLVPMHPSFSVFPVMSHVHEKLFWKV